MDALRENLIQRINVGDLLTRSAARAPGHLAVVDGSRRFTYRHFNALVNRAANGLVSIGYRCGEALAIMSRNNAEFLVMYFACAKIGVVCVPVNLLWRTDELVYVLGHSQARGAFVEAEFTQIVAPLREQLPCLREIIVLHGATPDFLFERLIEGMSAEEPEVVVPDRAAMSYLYTSGTTAAPKGVVGSHLAIYLGALGMAMDSRMTADDRVLAMLPLFHTTPLNSLCTPAIAAGATIYVLPKFDPVTVLDLFQAEGISTLIALPIMYRALLEHQERDPRNVSGLRLALYGMAPMPSHELRRLIEVFGCGFALIFGQTEMSPVTTIFRPEHQLTHAGAAGTPSVNVQVGIMDEAGRLLPQGSSGEIVYRSPQTATCYLRNEAATQDAFRHGWFHSGDAGRFDADGLLWFEDRFKDVIKSGGENVASVEVEQALYNVEPNILEVVVIGLPHDRWGEAVTAVAVPHSGATLDEAQILAKLRERLSPYKCPKAIIVAQDLPKTATAKVQKAQLRVRFAQFYNAPHGGAPGC